MRTLAVGLTVILVGCASAGKPRPSAGAALPRGVEISEICGDGDPMPRLRVSSIDPAGDGLPGASVEILEGSRIVTEGKADREGSVLFALEARQYTLAWELRGFVAPAPFPVRAKKGCEVQVVIQPALPPG
jgi:hypothetical protein